jgi:hypothetical protein
MKNMTIKPRTEILAYPTQARNLPLLLSIGIYWQILYSTEPLDQSSGLSRSSKARIPVITRSGKTGAFTPTLALPPQGGGGSNYFEARINNYLLRLIFLLKIEEETRSRVR